MLGAGAATVHPANREGIPLYRRLLVMLLTALGLVLVSCSGGGTDDSTKSIVVLSPDAASEIVVAADAFDKVVDVTTTAAEETTTSARPTTTTTSPPVEETTTTTEPPRTTVPLEEEELSPGAKLLDALDRFNSCLSTEGHTWIGMPSMEAGADAPENNSEYVAALILCNSRTHISTVYEEFLTSRTGLDPDEIRQQNEDFLDLTDCLRRKGWEISELTPDENGLLSPADGFASADGEFDTDQIRNCVGEIALERDRGGES